MVKAKRRAPRRPATTSTDYVDTVPDLPVTGLLRIAQVLKYVPISRTSWWLGVREGRFPNRRSSATCPSGARPTSATS
jgi:hypothetical protein